MSAIKAPSGGNARADLIRFAVEEIGHAIESRVGNVDFDAAVDLGFTFGEILDRLMHNLHRRGLCERAEGRPCGWCDGSGEEADHEGLEMRAVSADCHRRSGAGFRAEKTPTLRDQFAMAAVEGELASQSREWGGYPSGREGQFAERIWTLTDAVLAARERK